MTFLEYLLQPVITRLDRLEKKIMTGVSDLNDAITNLATVEAKFLTDLATALSGGISDAQAETLAQTINQRAADLVNADPANVPPPPPVTPGS